MPHSVVAFFCDDIRNESGGQHTIVGVLPDNMAVPRLPIVLPKLGVFLRAQLETGSPPKEFSISLKNSDGTEVSAMPQWDKKIAQGGNADAEKHKSPIFGLIGTVIFSPFRITVPGRIVCSVKIDDVAYVAGILNIILEPPTASEQPPLQSQTASEKKA